MADRYFACYCDENQEVLAVLLVNPESAAQIMAHREQLLAWQKTTPGLRRLVFDNTFCRFFHTYFNEEVEAVEALFGRVAEIVEDVEETADPWLELDGVQIPSAGDFRTAWENLEVSEHYLCFAGCGKHAESGGGFETPDLLGLLEAMVASDKKD